MIGDEETFYSSTWLTLGIWLSTSTSSGWNGKKGYEL